MSTFKVNISIVMEHEADAQDLFDILVELRVCKYSPDVEFIDYNREIIIKVSTDSDEEADKIVNAYRTATRNFVCDSDVTLEEFTASSAKMLYLDCDDFK